MNYRDMYLPAGVIRWPVVDSWVEQAKLNLREYEQNGMVHYWGNKEKKWVGCLGEIVFEMALVEQKIPYERFTDEANPGIDFRINGWAIDVKTSNGNYAPALEHNRSVDTRQLKMGGTDYYFFMYYMEPTADIYFCGGLSHWQFAKSATHLKKGELIPGRQTPHRVQFDISYVYQKDLATFHDWLHYCIFAGGGDAA